MLLHGLVGLVLTCLIKQLEATTVQFFNLCGNVTRSYDRLVYQSDALTVNINSIDWTATPSLICTVIFRAGDTDERLAYQFIMFSILDPGTSFTVETKDSLYYTPEGTYDMIGTPRVYAEKKAYTYLKLTLRRTPTSGSNAYISVRIKNRGRSFSIGGVMGGMVGLGVMITAVISAAFLRHRVRKRRSSRVCTHNAPHVNATIAARRPTGVCPLRPHGQQPTTVSGYPPTGGAPHNQLPVYNQGYRPLMVMPQQINPPPYDEPGHRFPSVAPASLPASAHVHQHQQYPNGYQSQLTPPGYELQTNNSQNPLYSNYPNEEPPPSYDQATKTIDNNIVSHN